MAAVPGPGGLGTSRCRPRRGPGRLGERGERAHCPSAPPGEQPLRLTFGTSDERGTLGVRGDVLLGIALQASLMAERFAGGAGDAEGRVGVSELVGAAQVSDDAINGNFGLCSPGRSS